MASSTRSLFVGVDVAFARGKPLPLCVAHWQDGRLDLLPLDDPPPRGRGNRFAIDEAATTAWAEATLAYLQDVERREDASISRIAIDAPRSCAPAATGERISETALRATGLRFFPTPTWARFAEMRMDVRQHLEAGGEDRRIPHGLQLWMLPAFKLFEILSKHYVCLETYPHAAARALGLPNEKKAPVAASRRRLAAVAPHLGWDDAEALEVSVRAALHDRVDALLAAYVAALPEERRRAYGQPPNDAIWIPG